GHAKVNQDDVAGAFIGETLDCLIECLCLAHIVGAQSVDKQLLQSAAEQFMVVRNERSDRHLSAFEGARATHARVDTTKCVISARRSICKVAVGESFNA